MRTELLLVERNYARKAIRLGENNQHQFKVLQLVFISCQILKKCSSANKLRHNQLIHSERTKAPATPQLPEANVSAQCEETLPGAPRQRGKKRETQS